MNIEIIDEDGKLKIYFPHDKNISEIKEILKRVKNNEIEVIRTDKLSLDQMKMLWSIFKDLGDMIGYTREELRKELENEYCNEKGIEYFSISPSKKDSCSKEIATDFITWLIEWSIKEGYNLIIHEGKGQNRRVKGAREICPDINRYMIACLRSKVCAVCGRIEADLHHVDNVNSIGGYEFDDGLKTRFMSLCREHHSLAHSIGQDEFDKRFILNGVWLNPTLVSELKKVYKNHFKAFDENLLKGGEHKINETSKN
ncbi:MAG: putative HNHc nuclease [Paraclostridium sp.]